MFYIVAPEKYNRVVICQGGAQETPAKVMSYDRKSAFSYFLAFLQHKIDREGARQVDIAKAIHVRSEYINRVYKERQGCSVDKQEKMAQYFGLSYLDALAIGKHLKETGGLPPDENLQPETFPTLSGGRNRRADDKLAQQDIVAVVSQWAAKNKATEASLTKLQNIIENLSDGIVILDNDLHIEYQNRTHREMFGGSLIGVSCNVAHHCEQHICECPSSTSKRTGMPARAIFPYAKGTVSALTTPIRSTSGTIIGYVTVIRDITERQKLMTMSEKALEMLDRAVFLYDAELNIKFHNSKLKSITGASDNDLVSVATFLKYLAENNIFKNYDEVVESIVDARERRIEANVTIHMSNGKTYLYNAKPMFTQKNVYIGRMGIFTPFD